MQFLSGGPPVNLTKDTTLPIQNRTISAASTSRQTERHRRRWTAKADGGLDRSGVFAIPAPIGGPPNVSAKDRQHSLVSRRQADRGREANPLVGDAVVVANADGSDLRVLVPARGGVHMHQVAWGADGQHVYYAHTIEAGHRLGEIRVAVGRRSHPKLSSARQVSRCIPRRHPTAWPHLCRGPQRRGPELWWHPLDGSPEVRLTMGSGEVHRAVRLARRHVACLPRTAENR